MINPREAVFSVLDADTPPDVRFGAEGAEFCGEKFLEAVSPLGEYLKRVPICFGHYPGNGNNVVVGDTILKQVAH